MYRHKTLTHRHAESKGKKRSCNSQGFHIVTKKKKKKPPRFWQKLEIAGRDCLQTEERDLYKFLKCIKP